MNSNYEHEYIVGNEIYTTLKDKYTPENITNISFSEYFLNKEDDRLLDINIMWASARGTRNTIF